MYNVIQTFTEPSRPPSDIGKMLSTAYWIAASVLVPPLLMRTASTALSAAALES